MHTIDPQFILGIAKVSEFGSRKYHMRNFLMAPGMCWSDVYGSLMRHLLAYWGGEELDVGPNGEFGETDDPETNMKWSGLPHIDMVAWNVMVLCTYRNHEVFHPGDDRPSTLEYVGGIWKDWQSEFDAIREIDAKPEPVAEERVRMFDEDNKGTKLGDEMTIRKASPFLDYVVANGPALAEKRTEDFNTILSGFRDHLHESGIIWVQNLDRRGAISIQMKDIKPEQYVGVQRLVDALRSRFESHGYDGQIAMIGDTVVISI